MFTPAELDKPLKTADLEELDALAKQYDIMFSVPGLQGFFAALATAPSLIPPRAWLDFLFEDANFESEKDVSQLMELVSRLYNQVVSQIRERSTAFLPEKADAEEWCFGYMRGVELDDVWDEEDDETVQEALGCIAAIADDISKEELEESLSDEDPEEWLDEQRENLPDTVLFLYDYWADARRPGVNVAKKKVGRNDPCPCGSGRKFKKCCGKDT